MERGTLMPTAIYKQRTPPWTMAVDHASPAFATTSRTVPPQPSIELQPPKFLIVPVFLSVPLLYGFIDAHRHEGPQEEKAKSPNSYTENYLQE
mmetsp:Transcript_7814/g.20300  ORF Transcript_7814/g.20300 Transcript_7814/m.20300 type:complete len:93 (+) Transcript_7814:1280-1558(+)